MAPKPPMLRGLAVVFVACVVSGCSSWSELGPQFAGRVSAIVATDASNVWVATPGGGVWKSTDGGATFTWPGNYGLGDFTAVGLTLDRNDFSRLYVRTMSGVLASTDGAAHWTRTLYSLPQGDTPYPYPSFCSSWAACPPYADASLNDPAPWAQTVFSPTQSVILTSLPCQGLQYSTDSGNRFTQLWPFSGGMPQRNPDNCITSIAVDDIDHRVWFTTMNDNPPHIYRSSVGWTAAGPPMGMTWDLVTNGIDALSHAPKAIVWGGGSASRMMTLVYTGSTHVPYLFDGNAWSPKPFNNGACVFFDARALAAGGTGNDFYAGGVTFAYTTDAGTSWTCPALGQQYVDLRAIFPSASAQRLWIGGDQNALGTYALLTRYTWSPGVAPSAPVLLAATGITSWQAYSVAKASSKRLLVGAQDVNVACSDDAGVHWTLTPTDEMQSLLWPKTGGGATVYAFGTKTVAYKASNAAGAMSCAALSWSNVSPSGASIKIFSAPHTMAVDPLHESNVFALTGGRVLYSTTAGASWNHSDLPLTTPTGYPVGLTAIFVDEDGVVYVGTLDHGVYTCADTAHFCDGSQGAGTWTPFALNPGGPIATPRYVTAIAESNPPPSPRTFWISTSQGVYRRLAGSTTWAAVDAINLYPYSDVVVDPTCKTRIYTALGYLDAATRTRGGVHVSKDNGDNWTSLTAGFALHNVPITQLLVDPANSANLFVSTYGRGVWRYTWGPTWILPAWWKFWPLPACAP